jgi:hypothetical protein
MCNALIGRDLAKTSYTLRVNPKVNTKILIRFDRLDRQVNVQKRKSKYPPYSQARIQALELQLNSRSDYIKWHADTKCQYLPRYPERVYREWVSWNDWLGTANVFKGDVVKPVRAFWEAVKWAQEFASSHKIDTMADWLAYTREHEDEMPDDIPLRPDTRYTEWSQIGWKGWLGTDVRGRMAAAKANTALFAICSHHNLRMPGNKYALVQADQGEAQLVRILGEQRDLRMIRCYKMDADVKEQVVAIIGQYGRDDGDGWFIPNVNNVVFELDQLLEVYRGSGM